MATSRPTSAAEDVQRPAPASGRRSAPSRTSTANGGSRWRAARWRRSEARKSRRSLLARPATMMPRTPIARARVSVSASIREPTTRMAPARPTSRLLARSVALAAGHERAAGHGSARPGRRSRASSGPDARMTMAEPGRTSRTMPATGVSIGSVRSPLGDAPAPAPLEQQLALGDAPTGLRQSLPGRDGQLAQAGVAQPLGDRASRPRPTRRRPRAGGRPGRAGR